MSLNHARKSRSRRADALAAMADGQLGVREAVWDGHGSLETCPVHKVLEAAPGMGPQSVRKVLERAHVWPLLPLGKLSKLQRRAIINELPDRVI